MNYLQKTAISIGIATAINGMPFKAQAQFCTDPSHTALTKSQLDEITASQGIPVERAPRAFQNFALATDQVLQFQKIPKNLNHPKGEIRQMVN